MTARPEQPSKRAARPRSLFDLTPDRLRELLATWNQPPYRATQILEWVYRRGATSYDDMTSLPKAFRTRLADELPFFESVVVRRQEARDGTIKLLLGWPDGVTCECVLISEARRQTGCLSTQVGCPVRCVFCASGLGGLQRQLTPGRIVEQAMRIRECCGDASRLSNVVLMGSGEPLANYDATVHALRTINAEWGMGIGWRKITVSTIGLPKQIRRLADAGMQITLALSLHAPTDELRRTLVPWAKRVTIESLIEAAEYYFKRTGREVTLEYVLLGGVNDSLKHAHQLAGIAHRMRSHVNVLAYNPVDGLAYERPSGFSLQHFVSVLRSRGVNVHPRRSRGRDIDAACGQLRRRHRDATHESTGSPRAKS